uniref:PiggyBac transposable element-derived protein domain-containing protein n=1 Tax=Homalodisca liturata TaxID=320908 RepID=A0A1B6HM41_9HEMI
MGGIDSTDQMLYVYMDERRTMKHAKKVIFNVFGRMVLNAYVLYKLNTTQGQLKRAAFRKEVIGDLSSEWLASKQIPQNLRGGGDGPSVGFGLRKLPEKKEKLCRTCSGDNHPEGKKRRSRTVCVRCGLGVHAECLGKHVCH